MYVCVKLSCFSLHRLFAALRTVAHHAQYGDARMLIEALLIIVSKWKCSKYLSTAEWIKNFQRKIIWRQNDESRKI